MSSTSSSSVAVRDALISAFNLSVAITASISGDIPSLLHHAYSRHFGEQMPSIHNTDSTSAPTSAVSLDSLPATLSKIPPLEPSAQALLDRARSILTSGPPLSMNVELADGEDLPVALHTLNQGAVWACLLGGGANPDLEDRALDEAHEKQLGNTDIHNRIRNALTPEAKCLWFLCRKFFFTLNVAEKDGKCYQHCLNGFYHHRMYMGRLFMLDTKHHTALTRARMPRALEVYSDGFTHIARTPKGMWGWGESDYGQLGFRSLAYREFVDPTRLTFPACPKIAELEASLPSWEKHELVAAVSTNVLTTFILTPVGAVVTGRGSVMYVGPVSNEHRFHPVHVPSDFVPDHIGLYGTTCILSMGDRQLICGDNFFGQLGLGHDRGEMTAFEELPFWVDQLLSSSGNTNVFLSGGQLLYAGRISQQIAQSGLLPGLMRDAKCLTAAPLRFPTRITGWYLDTFQMVWVSAGMTHYVDISTKFEVPFEATAVSLPHIDLTNHSRCFRDKYGQWYEARKMVRGVARMKKYEGVPRMWSSVIEVDAGPAIGQ
ncbi:phosphotyrosine-binding domain protein [Carpediemonas membranifera]|uniref:Phosphotyrosine-binding domain protein n=1 Tax=Carpediemonas membranifera TaxID=201153 RepID=A0A8J6DX68_9EUKA|nr:phosphotyrosine-binding domain protein [Carpediemonas membranifera]|eukprot:KAG9389469.1 phosphotyrosine-binding domain protein [Carpediemonas membranifera]